MCLYFKSLGSHLYFFVVDFWMMSCEQLRTLSEIKTISCILHFYVTCNSYRGISELSKAAGVKCFTLDTNEGLFLCSGSWWKNVLSAIFLLSLSAVFNKRREFKRVPGPSGALGVRSRTGMDVLFVLWTGTVAFLD